MSASDPKAEQILDAIKTVLDEMTGTYAPDKVVQVPAFHGGVLDTTYETICSISPGPHEEERQCFGTTNNIRADFSVGLALCRRFKNVDDEQRWDEQEELLRAALDAIRADRQLGGLALDLTVEDIDKSAANTYVEGWTVTFVRIEVMYLHSETAA